MQIEQIILRPDEDLVLVQHRDNTGRAGTVVMVGAKLEPEAGAALDVLLEGCQDLLPPEPEKPAQTEVEQEIAELEYRLEYLRKAVGTRARIEPAVSEVELGKA